LKAYKLNNFRFTILSILLVFIVSACSITRKLKDNESLVRKITIKGMDEEFAEAAVNYVDKEQQPNNILNLQLYYMFSKNGKKNIGEAPAILDSNLVEFSRFQIERFIQSKGYLKAEVTDSIIIKKKKAELVFNTVQGPMFRFRKLDDSIPDRKVANLYQTYRRTLSHVQPGGRFDADSLGYDRDEFFQVMKRNGYFDFLRQYLNYNYDTTYNSSVADIKTIIDNPADKAEHPVYTINNTLITIQRSNYNGNNAYLKRPVDTIQVDSQFRFVDYSGRFRPRVVTDYVFQKKGDIYNVDNQTLTTTRLSELNVFRNVPNPTYSKTADSTNRLNTKIDIVPLKQMSDRVEGEFLFAGGRYGYNLGNTFTHRNIFKDAAILQVKFNASVLYNTGSGGGVENQEFKIGANLIYPRIITPFNFAKPGKYGVPHTTFSTSYSLFFQKDLVERNSFNTAVTYDFFETANKLHSVTPLSIEFSKGIIDPVAKKQLEDNNRYSYIYLIGRTIFTTGSKYTYQVNANQLNTYRNFTYFRGSLDVGGNFLSGVSNVLNTPKDTLNQRTFFGYAFAQYVKAEIDFRAYKQLGGNRQFVFRVNPGIGIPFGNSNQLIFEKNFYAGGANDMRAWLPRTLGPGQFNRASYGTGPAADNIRGKLKYLDQFGEVKFVVNAEYRYKISNNFLGTILRGAVFMDAGNIWRLKKQDENPGGEFRFDNLLNSAAIGIGTGLRFDLGFFIFRLDAAFKFKDPQFNGADQWVLFKHGNELFKSGSFKQAYFDANRTGIKPGKDGKPDEPLGDRYNFMQLNFGIGMPF
jgi:outer membrane protein insertion porin family